MQDPRPSLYLSCTQFPYAGSLLNRYGLVVLTKLVPFEKGVILPHEKTFSDVKTERLKLIKACHANFSPIWALYPDRQNTIITQCRNAISALGAEYHFVDNNGHTHRFWRIGDEALHEVVATALADKSLYIADGHHRYETALAYLNWKAARTGGLPDNDPANYVMMHLTCMDDPSVVILPAHRLLKSVSREQQRSLAKKAEAYFHVKRMPFDEETRQTVLDSLLSHLETHRDTNSFGIFLKAQREFLFLTLKDRVMESHFGDSVPAAYRRIDVTVLTRLVFMELLGFDQQRLDNWDLIGYSAQARDAVEMVVEDQYDAAFILNPTRMDQVRHVADKGLIMPRKATYFYPKVITGLVMYKH